MKLRTDAIRTTPRPRYIRINMYDAESFCNGGKKTTGITINVTDMTEEEIEKTVRAIRDKQIAKNKEFRKKVPGKPRGRTTKHIVPIDTFLSTDKSIDNLKLELENSTTPDEFHPIFDKETGNTFCLFGASKSGKTTLMMKIYNEWWIDYAKPKKTLTTLFAMNPQIQLYSHGDEVKYIMKCAINPSTYSNSGKNIEEYIDWQRKMNKLNDNKFCFLNMFDDWIDIRYKNIVNNLIITYRNSLISSIICLQYVNLLSKAARSNVNNVFLLHMNTDESIEVAIKAYLSTVLKKINNGPMDNISAIQWYRDMTANFNWIYINPHHGIVYVHKTKMKYQM